MRSFVTCTVLASVASLASASIQARWEYPEAVPAIMRRQDPGTPAYACHENCGKNMSPLGPQLRHNGNYITRFGV